MSRGRAPSEDVVRSLLGRVARRVRRPPRGPTPIVTGAGEVVHGGDPSDAVYVVRPYSPLVQLAVRAALWTALGVGCLGGVVGLLHLPDRQVDPIAASSPDEAETDALPAPVAGTAELAVEEWLTATEEDRDRLDELFVEPVALRPADDGVQVDVWRLTTVAGHVVQDGYWVVTVSAEVAESVDDETQAPATWFVEIGIVGDVGGGLAALSTPGVMPAPPPTVAGWQSSRPALQQPSDGDPIAITVEGFLDTLLTGQGDPSRYLAPGVVIPAASPAPFVDLTVEEIAAEEQDNGDMKVWVDVSTTSPGGLSQPVAYELIATPRADRWEITAFWGAPSLGSAPAAED